MRPLSLTNASIPCGGTPVGGLLSASHSYNTLAIAVFLHTRMKTGGRGSSRDSAHAMLSSFHNPASMAIGVFAHFTTASGFGDPRRPPFSAVVSFDWIHRHTLK